MEMIETKHDLLTTKYTKVLEEAEYKYNAPHTFKVVKAAFGDLRNLSFTYCSECEKEKHDTNGLRKVACIVSILDMTALCSRHYLEKIQRESCKEYLDKHSPKLDLKDFARI